MSTDVDKPHDLALERRDKLTKLERLMLEHPDHLTPIDFVTTHTFGPGFYARTIEIPADCAIIGKIHRTRHSNLLSKGRIVVFTEDGGQQELEAPHVFVAEPGTKRAGYALTDTVWTTIHITDETDLEKLEAELIAPSYNALELENERGSAKCLG